MAVSTAQEQEIETLENMVRRGWYYLFRFQAQAAQEKQELERFLDQYYTRLTGWLQQAAYCIAATSGKGGETASMPAQHVSHQQQKQLYREVVKLCHPDAAYNASPCIPSEQKTKLLQQAMHAYSNADGYKLASLRLELQRLLEPCGNYQNILHQQYYQLTHQVTHARHALEKLRRSPAYRLRQQIISAQQQGYDLLSAITSRLNGTMVEEAGSSSNTDAVTSLPMAE